MNDLIATLEQATGPDWHLDSAIARLDQIREEIGDCADNEVPPYTTSLDTALTLVPEGCEWRIESHERPHPDGLPRAYIKRFGALGKSARIGRAPTPALALCIAALKVRSAIQ